MTGRLRIHDANRKWWILTAMGAALGLVLLDEVLVGVALPTIRDRLGLSQILSQWVVNAYVLALTVFVAAGGRLGDMIGHRAVFIAGAAILGVGSLAAGLAQSGEWLIASRAVQGFGTSVLLALSVAMIGIAFGEHERGAAIGIYGLIAAVPAALGPFIGGVLTDVVSWRWIFLINIPLVAGVIAIVAIAWRDERSATARVSFDLLGLTGLLAFLVPLVLALMQAPEWGWGSTTVLALLAGAALALAGFVWVERRARDPLIELGVLRRPTVLGANLVIFCAQFSKIAVIIFGALYMQDRLGMSPLLAGTGLLAAVVPALLTAVWSGRLTDRHGGRVPMLAGVAAMAVSLAWLAFFVPDGSYLLLMPGFALWGLSLPFLFNPGYTTVMNAVAAEQRGEASGVTSTGRQLGGALAVAVLGAVLVSAGSFVAMFWIAAGVTVAVWVTTFLLVDHPARARAVPVAPSHAS